MILRFKKIFIFLIVFFLKKGLLTKENDYLLYEKIEVINILTQYLYYKYGHVYTYLFFGLHPQNPFNLPTPMHDSDIVSLESGNKILKSSIFTKLIKEIEEYYIKIGDKKNFDIDDIEKLFSSDKTIHTIIQSLHFKSFYSLGGKEIPLEKEIVSSIDEILLNNKNYEFFNQKLQDLEEIIIQQEKLFSHVKKVIFNFNNFDLSMYATIYNAYILAKSLLKLEKSKLDQYINNFTSVFFSYQKKNDTLLNSVKSIFVHTNIKDTQFVKKALIEVVAIFKTIVQLLLECQENNIIDKKLLYKIMINQNKKIDVEKNTNYKQMVSNIVRSFGPVVAVGLGYVVSTKTAIGKNTTSYIGSKITSLWKKLPFEKLKKEIEKASDSSLNLIKNIPKSIGETIKDSTYEGFLRWKEDTHWFQQLFDIGNFSPQSYVDNFLYKTSGVALQTITSVPLKIIDKMTLNSYRWHYIKNDMFNTKLINFGKLIDIAASQYYRELITQPLSHYITDKTTTLLGPSFQFLSRDTIFNISLKKGIDFFYKLYFIVPFNYYGNNISLVYQTPLIIKKFHECESVIIKKLSMLDREKQNTLRTAQRGISYLQNALNTQASIYDNPLTIFFLEYSDASQRQISYFVQKKKFSITENAIREASQFAQKLIATKSNNNELYYEWSMLEEKKKELKNKYNTKDDEESQKIKQDIKRVTQSINDVQVDTSNKKVQEIRQLEIKIIEELKKIKNENSFK